MPSNRPTTPTYTPGVYTIKSSMLRLLTLSAGLAAAAEIPTPLLSAFSPLPPVVSVDPGRAALGRILFFETRISRDQKISCSTCHDLARFGVDGRPLSPGFNNQLGDRNTPTVLNASAHFAQFWDARRPDVETQAADPVLNPIEMAAPTPQYVVNVLTSIPGYVDAFAHAFPGDAAPITMKNIGIAIGAFERTLVTPARWDRFLAGDTAALTPAEKDGFLKFVDKGCDTCHKGALLGGHELRKLGAKKPWPKIPDTGRARVTRQDSDRFFFKVPSLRNVTRTAPYLHDGSIARLETVIAKMGEHQSGRKVTPAEATSIAVWLDALTGELPAALTRPPTLPDSFLPAPFSKD